MSRVPAATTVEPQLPVIIAIRDRGGLYHYFECEVVTGRSLDGASEPEQGWVMRRKLTSGKKDMLPCRFVDELTFRQDQ